MKGKKVKGLGQFETFDDVMSVLSGGIKSYDLEESRKNVYRDEFDGIVVDTVCAFDTQIWETGIKRDGGDWVIVSQYDNEKEAKAKHKSWVKLLKENPKAELKDINLWG